MPFNLDAVFTTLPYFYLGYLTSNNNNKTIYNINSYLTKNGLIYGLLLLILGLIIGRYGYIKTGKVLDVFFSEYADICLTYLSSILCVIGICLLTKNIDCNFLKYIGKNSIIYFAIHQSIIFVFFDNILWLFSLLNNQYILSVDNIYPIMITIFSLLLITIINEVLSKNKTISRLLALNYKK